ncbi:MAG: permease [Chthonomonadetes bacterium]|nr:permease [Chthonomonadetes bacterium]
MAQWILGGLQALQDYVVYHVLTCLIPAFLLAGGMVSFVPKEAVLRYLGIATHRVVTYISAAFASFFVAACSCTVIPVSAGVYFAGASIGAAFIILWVAPATNILALTYTGAILGGDMAVVRVISAFLMALVVGTVMTIAFRREEAQRLAEAQQANLGIGSDPGARVKRSDVVLLLLIVLDLLAPNYLIRTGPYWQKVVVWAIGMVVVAGYAWRTKTREEIRHWLGETWWFVRIILPLLLVGVFIVGVIGALLPESLVQRLVGGNSLRASFIATLVGAISYFATMTEAPFVHKLMQLGMGKGPALALLLTGPGLSLPNWIAIARVFGVRKSVVYVLTLVVLGTLVGWIAGNFVWK